VPTSSVSEKKHPKPSSKTRLQKTMSNTEQSKLHWFQNTGWSLFYILSQVKKDTHPSDEIFCIDQKCGRRLFILKKVNPDFIKEQTEIQKRTANIKKR
jgi:hypothetical protein